MKYEMTVSYFRKPCELKQKQTKGRRHNENTSESKESFLFTVSYFTF